MIQDKNGIRFFAWELDAKAIESRWIASYPSHMLDQPEAVEAYDYQMARMDWLKANVSL